MRVITGKRKGLRLRSPEGDNTRPTESRIKESLFNILGNVSDSVVCDLFAGSGGIGIEFLSRDAKEVYFVENNDLALKVLKNNLDKVNLTNYKIIPKDYKKAIKSLSEKNIRFDYVYIDPPYDRKDIYNKSLELLSEISVFENSLIIVESDKDTNIENLKYYEIIDERKYRSTILYFLRRK